jgi:Polyketide cyclase / dehydrase and lipid transport
VDSSGAPTPSSSIEIRCSPMEAFAYVSDISSHPEWSIDDIRVLEAAGRPGLGARYRTVGHSIVMERDLEAEIEVTVFDPPSRFAFVARSGPATFENRFRFRAVEGGTIIERTLVSGGARSAAVEEKVRSLAHEIVRRREAALDLLKERLEARSVSMNADMASQA